MTGHDRLITSTYPTTIQNDSAPNPVVEVSLNNVPTILRISLIELYTRRGGKGAPVQATKAYRESGGTAPLILHLGTNRWVVDFKPRLLYPEKEFQYRMNRMLGGPHSQSGRFGKEKK
jgi:hypothetical protein